MIFADFYRILIDLLLILADFKGFSGLLADFSGPPGSKIGFSSFNLDGFDTNNMIPTSIRARNITFDQFLKIF